MAGSNVSTKNANAFFKDVNECILAIMSAGVSYDRISLGIKEEFSFHQDAYILIGDLAIKQEVYHGT